MIQDNDQLQEDIKKINQITIVPTMLEVVCRATGMGFSAIARVTEDRWIACSVRDEVNFGLKAGDELQLETTICNEIRQNRQGVVIDHVAADQQFCEHHTPKMYGFQSYISIPIVLNTGQFFGTLCALDKNPAKVSDLKITGMFTLFTQLIAFHLQALDALEHSNTEYHSANKQMLKAQQETSRYEHITYHSLREPVRKISLFSDLLLQAGEKADLQKMREKAIDINRFSNELAGILRQLNEG
jgi:hypothetical protein